jgi:hypothetical protein
MHPVVSTIRRAQGPGEDASAMLPEMYVSPGEWLDLQIPSNGSRKPAARSRGQPSLIPFLGCAW